MSGTKRHEIKIRPEYYKSVIAGMKTFELRENDRQYEVGDEVKLMEWDEEGFTGRYHTITITYVLQNVPEYGLADGFCIFGWR